MTFNSSWYECTGKGAAKAIVAANISRIGARSFRLGFVTRENLNLDTSISDSLRTKGNRPFPHPALCSLEGPECGSYRIQRYGWGNAELPVRRRPPRFQERIDQKAITVTARTRIPAIARGGSSIRTGRQRAGVMLCPCVWPASSQTAAVFRCAWCRVLRCI